MSRPSEFPQTRLTRAELREKLHAMVDAMVDVLPLADDREAQLAGFVDLSKISLTQTRGFERIPYPEDHEEYGKDELRPTLHRSLKFEIFPETLDSERVEVPTHPKTEMT